MISPPHAIMMQSPNVGPTSAAAAIRLRREDYLTIRLRRMVQHVIKQDQPTQSSHIFTYVTTADNHVFWRTTWILVFMTCLLLFVNQSYERISYYLSYPVTVDVLEKETNSRKFPMMTICYDENEDIFDILDEFPFVSCGSTFAFTIMSYKIDYNASYIWQLANATSALFSALLITHKGSFPLNHSNVPLPEGTCTSFRSGMGRGQYEVVFKTFEDWKCHGQSGVVVFIHDAEDYPKLTRSLVFAIGNRIDLEITSKQINFVNRTNHPCISAEDYRICQRKCYLKYLLNLGSGCKYPFFLEQVNGSSCLSYTKEAIKRYRAADEYLRGVAKVKPCVCIRKCQHRVFNYKIASSAKYRNQSVFTLRFHSRYDTFIQERLCYDFITLLSDIGGNSGLYIGLSVLSIFQLMHLVALLIVKKSQPRQYFGTDPLFRIVSRTCNRWKAIITRQVKRNPRKSKLISVGQVLSRAICTTMLVFAIANRVMFYLSHPTRNVLQVKFIQEVEMQPTIIICPGDDRAMLMQKEIAENKKYDDICEVQVWELFDLPQVDANYIWMNEEVRRDEGDFWHKFRFVSLVDGTCLDFDVEKNESDNLLLASSVQWFRSKLKPRCGTDYQKIYIKPATGDLDYLNYRYLPTQHKQHILIVIKEIVKDESIHSCVPEHENEKCVRDFLNQKLFSQINCRLPYMPDTNMPMCNSSSAVKHSHLIYLNIYLTPDGRKDCDCLPKCHTTIFDTRVYNEWDIIYPTKRTSFTFGLANPILETFHEQSSYPLIKLLCDIGGWLGALLGLCILTSIELITITLKSKFLKENL